MAGLTTGAGAALAISAAAPATQDAAGYGAVVATEIGNIEKIGSFGASFAKVEFQPLKGAKQKLKGSPDYGALQPSYAHDSADAGQTLLRTAAKNKTNTLYTFIVTLQDGQKFGFQGRVFSAQVGVEGADNVTMASPMVEICTEIVEFT